ncbi:profilin, required for normal timing of actin polymerization in response to thermal stress [Coemansia interrupta]|uniref:Profilin n=1 Tax=Coemansia interrupta TaxID=1126814 RepID=A0A9W8LLS1_9FUNG|nr:profilin, required for normal timing of actin polymerization in response to thermal stress [Coemansia interrupta]
MSWQPYIDSNLIGTGKIAHAGIYGLDGGVWAISPNFPATREEVLDIVKGFSETSDLPSKGLRIGGTKFMVSRVEDTFVFSKYRVPSEENQTANNNPLKLDTIMCAKANKCIIIAGTIDTVTPASARPIVENLRDYLVSVGY